MPMPALLLLLATLLPLASLGLLLLIGRRLGNPLAGWFATACAAGGFALSIAGMIAWYNGGQLAGMTWGPGDKPIELAIRWFPSGPAIAQAHPSFFYLHLYIDTLTIAMFNTITLVVVLSHAFSISFLVDEKRFDRFFVYLQLLSFSVLGLVIGGNILQILLFWQLLSLAGYFLTRFWRPDPPAGRAVVSFIANRIGDAGLLVGIGILFHTLGNATILQIERWQGAPLSARAFTIVGVALFVGAAARSAQFPLHFWLPASARAPIPAAALIQTVTLTAAGVYLLARIFPMLTPSAKLLIGIVGITTLLFGAVMALFQRDFSRILVYNTVSQFGLMFMAIGIGSWIGGLFLLLTHALFKSLLILSAGSVIHAAHGEQRLAEFGGLIRKMPVTATTFAIGLLAISAAPFTSGYYSSEMIFVHTAAYAARAGHGGIYWTFFIVPAGVSALTAFYLMRCWMLVFWGRPRNLRLHVAARERASLWFPIVALAAMSLLGGSRLLDIKNFIAQSCDETENYSNAVRDPAATPFAGFADAWPIALDQAPDSVRSLEDNGEQLFRRYAIWPFGVGILVGFVIYCRARPIVPRAE